MTDILNNPYYIKILKYISCHSAGVSEKALELKFGKSALVAADELYNDDYLEREDIDSDRVSQVAGVYQIGFSTGNFKICDKGEFVLKSYQYRQILTRKEKWIERLWGFISGVALTVIAWFLSTL